jgi:hypothetical protein
VRDLVGYGGRPPKVDWPGGARLAVSVVVNFEEGAESSIEAGDPAAERIGEVTTVIPPGVRDVGQEQLFAYGMRAGVWRVLDLLSNACRLTERRTVTLSAVRSRDPIDRRPGWSSRWPTRTSG